MEPQQQMLVDRVFRVAVGNRARIIFFFKILYSLFIVLTILGGYSAYYLTDSFLFFYDIGIWAGKFSLIFYILTVIPGIFRRFGIKHKLAAILMIFRRYTGIAMFMGVLSHYVILRGAATLRNGLPNVPPPLFETAGLIAFTLTFLLFITSNDFAVRKLKSFWAILHKLTYVIIWFVAIHLFLQRISVWSVAIGITLVAQLASFAAVTIRKRKNSQETIPPKNTPG